MQYIVTRNFYEGSGLHEEGNAFVHSDQAYIEKCLADGNIAVVAAADGGSESSNPLAEQPQASVSAEAPQTVSPVDQAPVAPQAVQPVSQPAPQEPVQTQEQTPAQPTPEEIAATLAASESDSAPSEPTVPSSDVQIS
jgi:hypothetical protein